MGRWIAAAGLTWVTLLAGAMTPQTQGNTSQAIADPEAYAVIASILPTEWLISVAHAKTLVVQSETPASWPCALDRNPPDPDWRMAFGAFRAELGKVRSWQAPGKTEAEIIAFYQAAGEAAMEDLRQRSKPRKRRAG